MSSDHPTASAATLSLLPDGPGLAALRDRLGRVLLSGRKFLALAAALALAAVALALWIVVSDYRDIRDRAEASLTNIAHALEQNIGRNIDLYDLAIQETVDALSLPGLAGADPEIRHAALFSRIATAEYMVSILVIDKAGNVTFDSDQIVPRTGNFADRDFFRVPRDQPGLGLYVGTPVASRVDQRDVIAFSRRVTEPGGGFGGVVTGSVQLNYFRHLFSNLDLGKDSAVALFRADGTLVARHPAVPGQTGRNILATEPFHGMLQSVSGIMSGTSAIDGVERLYAYQRIGSYPLLVTTAYSRATEPFFTTKPVGQGTGLGLSMARTYAEARGGMLAIDSQPGFGTTISLWLAS